MKKNRTIIFASGEGIGNTIETLPTLRTIKEVLGFDIVYWHAFGSFSIPGNLLNYISKFVSGKKISTVHPKDFAGVVSTRWAGSHIKILLAAGLKLLAGVYQLSMEKSEVDTYMNIARDLGAAEQDLIWAGNCRYNRVDRKYDIVISNGYNPSHNGYWKIKSYPYYTDVARLLGKKYRVCSIGTRQEYVKGTFNETGLSLLDSLGIIKNSRLLISNDSGMYHCANALEVPNIVIFTATSVLKNYDKRFHRYATVIGRDDLACRPCQRKGGGCGWEKCKTWECRNIKPEVIVKKTEELLNG